MALFRYICLLLLVCGSLEVVIAQKDKLTVSPDEQKAIKKIEAAKDFAAKMKAANEFLKKFPTTAARPQVANYLAGEVFASKVDAQSIANATEFMAVYTDPKEIDLVLPNLVFAYIGEKNYADAFSFGEKFLSRNADEVRLRLQLSVEGSNGLRTGSKTFASQTINYSQEAIALIEANKKPANINDDEWKEYQSKWLPVLYQALGLAKSSTNKRSEALAAFEKASILSPQDPNNWYLIGNIYDEEYNEIAKEYAISEGQTQAELLKKAQAKLDKVIDYFARVAAITDGDPNFQGMNIQIRENLQSYYQFRNKSLNGLEELIKKYRSLKTAK